jgi:cytoskeletal protein RodZ
MLCLLPGAIATAYAQEHEQEKKPEQKQQETKPAKQSQKAKPAEPAKQQAAHQQEAKPAAKPQQAKQQKQAKPEAKPQQAAHQQKAEPAKQQARGQNEQASRGQAAGGHGSIPEAKFRSSFGSSHTFHVNRSDWASGSARFQYGGYWFNAVDPWPVAWLYTDNVYVDFLNGGYFLCDPVHPGVYISINIG